MPNWPQGQKRPADVIDRAVELMHIATREQEGYEDYGKDSGAKALEQKVKLHET